MFAKLRIEDDFYALFFFKYDGALSNIIQLHDCLAELSEFAGLKKCM